MQVLELNSKDYEGNKINAYEVHIDQAFRKIKSNYIGLYIWKVENDRVEEIPREKYGQFCDQSTYIIYAALINDSRVTESTLNRELKSNCTVIQRFIHFWLGSKTSSERSGAVAYKVIELDNHLGNGATQYREAQEHESDRFKSYFKNGFIIFSDSLLFPITTASLFQVKGKKSPMCIQRSMDWHNFNSTYTMLLKTQKYVFIWIGRLSSQSERINAIKMAEKILNHNLINDGSGERVVGHIELVIVDDGYEQSMNDIQKADWNHYLCLTRRLVNPIAVSPISTLNVSFCQESSPLFKLYKCGFVNGKYRIEEVKSSRLQQSNLNDSSAAFIIDSGWRGVWIWMGRCCQVRDRAEAMRNARGFVKKKKYSATTPVARVIEQYEPIEFISLFPNWCQPQVSTNNSSEQSWSTPSNKQLHVLGKFDAQTLYQRPKLAAATQLIDDGSGETTIYKVHNKKLIEMPRQKSLTCLYSGDCFLIHYIVTRTSSILFVIFYKVVNAKSHVLIKGKSYYLRLYKVTQTVQILHSEITENNLISSNDHPPIVRHILYVWTGAQCTNDIQANGEHLATELHRQLNKSSVMQVRVFENYEPPHLLQIFKGKLIIFNGKCDVDLAVKYQNIYLLKVTGDSTFNSKAVQVTSRSTITSKDCLILNSIQSEYIWVWCGQCSTGDTREITKQIASTMGEYSLVLESNESADFWQHLPDEIESKLRTAHLTTSANNITNDNIVQTAALYIVSSSDTMNNVAIQQIMSFEQSELTPEDLYLLDSGKIIYIWIGKLCSANDKQFSWQIIKYYFSKYATSRDVNTPVALIQQGCEPVSFIGHFDKWDSKLWDSHKSFGVVRLQIESPNQLQSTSDIAALNYLKLTETDKDFDQYPKYPLEVLRGEINMLPEEIDPKHKESHLTFDDFMKVFSMTFSEFCSLPDWRRKELKKQNKLF